MQAKCSIPNVRDKRTRIKQDDRGFYVAVAGSRWYSSGGWIRDGLKVIVRFDVPGSDTVSVWTLGDILIGEFTRA
jgi:hypothetical protein